ncbi:hypothetical protein LZ198_17865 [Myxococcus sp. K15C18031901]|uniref:Kelch repeat-containing protein n=1 Tax=Myxococcus dinghuensis TaxID=2906761 RepID=UPI0020A7E9BE|nr:kelch repeat-containing protein [Myxococcus dinghuensis]MCP3100739.1 hypothetical protein [Myxococcus dinghuensis]
MPTPSPEPGPTTSTLVLGEGADTHVLPANDDGSAGPIELGFPVNFFGTLHTSVFINTNGNVTFQEPLYKYLPFPMGAGTPPIIAPFLSDVDVRGATSARVRYGTTTFEGSPAFCVNWIDVGYHAARSDKRNRFQLLLVDRNDLGLGSFDVVMNYDRLVWESGESGGGSDGLGGHAAGGGFSSGTGEAGTAFEFPGARTPGALLDDNATTGLARTRRNSSILGRHIFRFRGGRPELPRPAGRSQKAVPRAVLRPDGRVLVLGDSQPIVDLFVPASLGTPDAWVAAHDSLVDRRFHTATLLEGHGQVLVTGGESQSKTTELHDPLTDTWRATAPMSVGRISHTATRLNHGQVLVTGGYNPDTRGLDTCELYTARSDTWTATGTLGTGRSMHTATLLPEGRVLVTGGLDASSKPLRSTELYDPATGTWTPAGDMESERSEHTATLMQDGRVLVAGGTPFTDISGSAEVYDPAEGTWTRVGDMAGPRRKHTATLLPTCHVLVTGGGHEHGGILDSVELYDVHSGTWSTVSSLSVARSYHAAVLLNDGRVLIVGGANDTARGTYELYYPPRHRK